MIPPLRFFEEPRVGSYPVLLYIEIHGHFTVAYLSWAVATNYKVIVEHFNLA